MISLWGNQFRVNSALTNNQEQPSTTVLSDGREVIAWRDGSFSLATLRYKVLNVDGSVARAEATINSDTTGNIGAAFEGNMQITALASGGFVAVWEQRGNVGNAVSSIYFQIFDAAGAPVGTTQTQIPHPVGSSLEVRPSVAAIGTGFQVVWQTSDNRIVSSIYGETGALTLGPFLVSDTAFNGDGSPTIAARNILGNTVTFWEDSFGATGSTGGIWGNVNGQIVRADAQKGAPGNPGDQHPEAALDGNGNVLVAWVRSSANAIEAAVNPNGSGGVAFQVNTTPLTTATPSPEVVGLKTGGWLVVWHDGTGTIRARELAPNSALVGPEFVVATGISVNGIDAAELPDGRVIVTWDASGGTTGLDVQARYLELRTGPVTWNGALTGEQYAGTTGNDTLNGAGGDDFIVGWIGDDRITGGAGKDTVDGGEGTDTAVFTGTRSQYNIIKQSNGSYSITDTVANRDGTDTLISIEKIQFSDVLYEFANATRLAELFAPNLSQGKAIAATYQTLLGGTPSIDGFDFLIKANVTSNFGAGAGTVFNDENIYINIANALVQGNAAAAAKFNTLAAGATLSEKVTSLYKSIIPAAKQAADGIAFLTRPDGLTFYQNVATERGITAANGPAVVALASLLKVAVDGKIGIGNPVGDLVASIVDGSSGLPASSAVLLPIETIDGTKFDADDAPDAMPGFSGPPPAPLIGVVADEVLAYG